MKYVKGFNEGNLKERMTITKDIIQHNKKLGVPMGVELGWKVFKVVPGEIVPKDGT